MDCAEVFNDPIIVIVHLYYEFCIMWNLLTSAVSYLAKRSP